MKLTNDIELIHGDCMDYMAGLPDNAFELAIVDPPYGIGMDGDFSCFSKNDKGFLGKRNHKKKKWDVSIPEMQYFTELYRASKNQIIWGGNYFTQYLPSSMGWIVWDKKVANLNNKNFSDCELAYTSFKQRLIKYTYDWIGFGYLNNPQGERKIHPTQKPVALYKWLLHNYAKEGDRILDTHLGSASSAIAAHDMGFKFVGIEIDCEYYDAAVKRVKNVVAQTKLQLT